MKFLHLLKSSIRILLISFALSIYDILQNLFIWQVVKVFAVGLGELGSIPCCIISKTLKIVHDTSLLKTQQYEVHIISKVE